MLGDSSKEGQVVDEAMYALRALRNCMELKTSEPEDAYTTFLQDFLARAADTRIG